MPNAKKDYDYKFIYLVGINEKGDQVLITFRHKEVSGIPVLQLENTFSDLAGSTKTEYFDYKVEHLTKYIQGGVPGWNNYSVVFPTFVYSRETLQLRFDFNDTHMSCVVMEDTAMPFIELIARM
jgi:hypothetical protein